MHKTELTLSFESLEKMFNLPSWVKITGVHQTDVHGVVQIRMMSSKKTPEGINIPDNDAKKVGDAFRHPKKYAYSNKGETRGS